MIQPFQAPPFSDGKKITEIRHSGARGPAPDMEAESVERRLWALCMKGRAEEMGQVAQSEEARALTAEQRLFAFRSALRQAAFVGNEACVREMLRHVDDRGREPGKPTAMALAASQGHLACVQALLPHSDPNERGDNGDAALHCALNYLHEKTALFLAPLTDKSLRDAEGNTPLMSAASMGRLSLARALLPGSDPLAVNERGRSALALAVMSDHADCVAFLAGVSDVFALDWADEAGAEPATTPLGAALLMEHWECADALSAWLPPEDIAKALAAAASFAEDGETPESMLPLCAARKERHDLTLAAQEGQGAAAERGEDFCAPKARRRAL